MALYLRIDGLDPEDVGHDRAQKLADDVFAQLYPRHEEDLTGVVPVMNEQYDPKLGGRE